MYTLGSVCSGAVSFHSTGWNSWRTEIWALSDTNKSDSTMNYEIYLRPILNRLKALVSTVQILKILVACAHMILGCLMGCKTILWKYYAARFSFSAWNGENLKYHLHRLLCCNKMSLKNPLFTAFCEFFFWNFAFSWDFF